jgi:hypothetical protein
MHPFIGHALIDSVGVKSTTASSQAPNPPKQIIRHSSIPQVFTVILLPFTHLASSHPTSPHLSCSYHLLPLLLLFFTLAVETKEGIAILVMPTEAVLFKSRRSSMSTKNQRNGMRWEKVIRVFGWMRCHFVDGKICIVSRKCMNVNRLSRQEM